MTDIQYIKERVQALQSKIRIKGTCHIWQGKWHHGQPEAKFEGRRQSILPYVYAAYHGAMPADGAACRMTCGEPLCVNPEHMQARARQIAIIRSNRTKSVRTFQRRGKGLNHISYETESEAAAACDERYMARNRDRDLLGSRNKRRGGYNGS